MRDCDGCTLCCHFARVVELKKKENVLCKYCVNKSCSIYEFRPAECATYYCEWALENTPEELKPDKIGIMFEKVSEDVLGVFIVKEKESTWLTPEVQKFCDEQVEKGISLITNTRLLKLSGTKTEENVLEDIGKRLNGRNI